MNKITLHRCMTLCLAFIVATANAGILNVPSVYPTIQNAINASVSGDTVAVAPGIYFENINFRGKNIMVTSLYYLSGDTNYVYNTIINGSQPVNADTASCVIINSGEDSTAVLQGFTITGGHGTKWTDEHGAGVYREGGGILIAYSAPVIQHNLIVGNQAMSLTGVISSGGGGIRAGDGNPKILNNTISHNQARYGEAIVLNYSGGVIRNNLICYNSGGSQYGAAAIWSNAIATEPRVIENNTIVKNVTANGSSGFYSLSTTGPQSLINNILFDNHSTTASIQILISSGGTPTTVTFCDVQNGFAGTGNINLIPAFADTDYFYPSAASPCVDAGDSSVMYNDLTVTGTTALFPSMGLVRNDMGAYGGQGAGWLPSSNPIILGIADADHTQINFSIAPNPFRNNTKIAFTLNKKQHVQIVITNISGSELFKLTDKVLIPGKYEFSLDKGVLKPGIYFCKLMLDNEIQSEKIIVE